MMKLTLKEGQKVWFCSDTHFNHLNLCLGTSSWSNTSKCRDFLELENMDSTIIDRINKYVGQDDILFHLGDFSFNGFENIEKFRNRIICKNVHLILGNHDHHIENNREDIQSLFSSVNQYLELEIKTGYKDPGKLSNYNVLPPKVRFILSHYPICSWKDMNQGVVHLFGHVHLPYELRLREGKALDVGVEGNDFYPYELKDIIGLIRKQPIRSITIPQDHHQEEIK